MVNPNYLDWRSLLLGSAVGVAGPAYFGTLFGNLTMWALVREGHSVQEAYAYLFQFNFSFPVIANFVVEVCCAVACGWVAASYGSGHKLVQGLAAGLLTASFPLIMLMSPAAGPMPLAFRVMSLAIPIVGSTLGAYAAARKA
jgi:hypothetical protein